MELLDDPEGHQTNMFYSVVSQNNSTNYFLSFYDKDNPYDLASNLKCKAYCYGIDSENRQYKKLQLKIRNLCGFIVFAFKSFCKSQARCILMWEERVENLRKKSNEQNSKPKVAGKAPDDGPLKELQEELHQEVQS